MLNKTNKSKMIRHLSKKNQQDSIHTLYKKNWIIIKIKKNKNTKIRPK